MTGPNNSKWRKQLNRPQRSTGRTIYRIIQFAETHKPLKAIATLRTSIVVNRHQTVNSFAYLDPQPRTVAYIRSHASNNKGSDRRRQRRHGLWGASWRIRTTEDAYSCRYREGPVSDAQYGTGASLHSRKGVIARQPSAGPCRSAQTQRHGLLQSNGAKPIDQQSLKADSKHT